MIACDAPCTSRRPAVLEERELELRAAYARIRDQRLAARAPAQLLERLFELHGEAPTAVDLPERPFAGALRGHDPQVRVAVLRHRALVRLPVVHQERVRDYARAWLHPQDRRP